MSALRIEGHQEDDTGPNPTRTKVRTGCMTCNIRRVKCDEEKPACVRCTSTRRNCDGYVNPSKKKKTKLLKQNPESSISIAPSNYDVFKNGQEHQAFHYSRIRAAGHISGYFHSDFWERLILHICYSEPAVRHSLLALSSLHEGFARAGSPHSENCQSEPYRRLALQQYNKAVSHMAKQLSSRESAPLETTLTICLLFIWLELMQSNYITAIVHLTAGLQILSEYEAMCNRSIINRASLPSGGVPFIKENFVQMFARVVVQVMFLGAPYPQLYLVTLESVYYIPQTFSGMSKARMFLDLQLVSIYRYLASITKGLLATGTLLAHQQQLENQLQLWHSTFQRYLDRPAAYLGSKGAIASVLLQLHHTAASIVLVTSLSSSQAIFDPFKPAFAHVLYLAESILTPHCGSDSDTGKLPSFSFDMGFIAPLFYTATKCRDSTLRWRAVSVLHHCPSREGMWDSALAARLAERVVEMEEEGMPSHEPLPEANRISEIDMSFRGQPEQKRVVRLSVSKEMDAKQKRTMGEKNGLHGKESIAEVMT